MDSILNFCLFLTQRYRTITEVWNIAHQSQYSFGKQQKEVIIIIIFGVPSGSEM